jgi:hypothetical protein
MPAAVSLFALEAGGGARPASAVWTGWLEMATNDYCRTSTWRTDASQKKSPTKMRTLGNYQQGLQVELPLPVFCLTPPWLGRSGAWHARGKIFGGILLLLSAQVVIKRILLLFGMPSGPLSRTRALPVHDASARMGGAFSAITDQPSCSGNSTYREQLWWTWWSPSPPRYLTIKMIELKRYLCCRW